MCRDIEDLKKFMKKRGLNFCLDSSMSEDGIEVYCRECEEYGIIDPYEDGFLFDEESEVK